MNKRLPKFKNFMILKNDYLDNENLLKNKFHLIICWEVIHWLGNYQKIIKTIEMFKKMLLKESHLIITFPAKNHYLLKNPRVNKYTYKIKNNIRKNMLICAPPLKEILQLFKKKIFEVKVINHYSHCKISSKNKKKLDIRKLNNPFSMYAFLLKKR